MADPVNYFRPAFHEGVTIFVPNFAEGWRDYSGAEALRRSGVDFHNYYRNRIPYGPWIVPLMKINTESARKKKADPPLPDLFLTMGNLFVTDAALDVMRPFCGVVPGRHRTEEIEFLPVELVTGGQMWWVNPPVLPDVLDLDRSSLTRSTTDNAILSIDRPILRRSALTGDHIFDPRKNPRCPIFSGAVVQAFELAGIGGVDWKPVEII